ncbi:LysR family transcriptional regulator [Acuticoccus kandeliae]|uniref:LysR family transcriptional regulator n=1 Tax=Acuticoccus kandeliae TaxID=2073160 RepID=UPI000D3E77DF|nr:LysR family transcriptional regulator [Acuticoccus kandeliae]
MDLDDLRAFVEVANAGGLTAASRRIGVSKSVLSRRLTRIEAALAARLINRTTRGVALTEAGEAFKTHAERMLAAFEDGRNAVHERGAAVTGRLRVSASISFGITHLAPVLAELALRHPQLEIHASYTDRIVDLIGERFDAAIRIGALRDSSLIARRVAPIRAALVASPAYLADHPRPATLTDLRAHAAIVQENAVWRFSDGRRETQFTPPARFVTDSGHAILAAVLAGVGIAYLPLFLCAEAIASGALETLLPDLQPPDSGLFVVRPPPAGRTPPNVAALTNLLVERFATLPL